MKERERQMREQVSAQTRLDWRVFLTPTHLPHSSRVLLCKLFCYCCVHIESFHLISWRQVRHWYQIFILIIGLQRGRNEDIWELFSCGIFWLKLRENIGIKSFPSYLSLLVIKLWSHAQDIDQECRKRYSSRNKPRELKVLADKQENARQHSIKSTNR